MLKRLELSGFKSFAEKTVFDLTPGITAIVGPNGSGKSNIVDAIRWVLGEQSAKNLRGSGMADVLFNGTRTRKPLNLSQVSLTFDNSSELLGPGMPEVRITRRLYRDGTSEYLVNDQISRLKDIRDILLGSGADAYSIIAQGQVDALLNSNPEERRHVFEEAAGISRFRLRRQEALKRLDRVRQNLVLIDSQVDRIERQLRQARQESGKAAAKQALALEIGELRRRRDLAEFGQLRIDWDGVIVTGSSHEDSQHIAPGDLRNAREEWRRQRTTLATRVLQGRDVIAQYSRERAHEWANLTRFGEEAARSDLELSELRSRLPGLWAGISAAKISRVSLAQKVGVCKSQSDTNAKELSRILADLESLTQLRSESAHCLESLHGDLLTILAVRNANTSTMVQAQGSLSGLQKELNRTLQRQDHLRGTIRQTISQVSVLIMELEESNRLLLETNKDLTEATKAADEARNLFVRFQRELHQSGLDREVCRGRAEVLDHLETSREGLASGVREVFSLLDGENPGPWNTVLGLAGDFLHVRREYAPVLDLLLGERAQRLLVRDQADLAQALLTQTTPFSGRVSFLGPKSPFLEAAEPEGFHSEMDWEGMGLGDTVPEGVVALAENLARCDLPGFLDLPQILLGKSVVVTDLASAIRLTGRFLGFRLITLAGEIIEPDGTLTLGHPAADSGIVSRKAELKELREKILEIHQREKTLESNLAKSHQGLDEADSWVDTLENQQSLIQDRLALLSQRLENAQSLIGQLEGEAQGISAELIATHEEMAKVSDILEQARNSEALLEAQTGALESKKTEAKRVEASASVGLDKLRQHQSKLALIIHSTDSESVQWETASNHLEDKLLRMEQQQEESLGRLHDLGLAGQASALLYLHGIQQVARLESVLGELSLDLHPQLGELARLDLLLENAEREQDALQEAHNQRVDRLHKMQLARQQSVLRIEALTKRNREEEGIDIAGAWHDLSESSRQELAGLSVPALDKRLGDARNRLGQMGPGDSLILTQLDQLEKDKREITLYRADLTGAQAILEDILKRLDAECGRMFLATFEEIRIQFQDLFRKLFGGGQADLILDNKSRPLDASIDIAARPPGKEMRSLGLLSGGEKTMTVVALLLAIFRHKPSPFCLMDEVDAALDEANVGRFAGVLRDFCDKTQFMLITHSKKTMSVADTLLGITMQESGVSTRVAVRIEDWVGEEAVKKAA